MRNSTSQKEIKIMKEKRFFFNYLNNRKKVDGNFFLYINKNNSKFIETNIFKSDWKEKSVFFWIIISFNKSKY